MNIEELRKEERKLFALVQESTKKMEQSRDTWHEVYRAWMAAVEEEKINQLVEKRLKAKV